MAAHSNGEGNRSNRSALFLKRNGLITVQDTVAFPTVLQDFEKNIQWDSGNIYLDISDY